MENTLTNQVASVEINKYEYPKNTLFIEIDGELVTVKTVAEGKTLGSGDFNEWKTGATPYASKGALVTALRGSLYA